MIRNTFIRKACLFSFVVGGFVTAGRLHAQGETHKGLAIEKDRTAGYKASTGSEAKLIEVTDELPCDPGSTVYIGDIIRRVTVLTTHENKVRLVTTVAYEGTCRYSNEQWLDILELKVSGRPGHLHVKCGNMEPGEEHNFNFQLAPNNLFFSPPGPPAPSRHRTPDLPQRKSLNDLTPNGTVVFDASGKWLYKKGNIRRNIYVYVPIGTKLDIESRYAEVIVDSNVREVNARIMNGNLTMRDADKLVLTNSYGSVYVGNIVDARVDLIHGWFHAKNMSILDINSKVSTVELGAQGKVKMISNDDQYEMESAEMISGGKNYGSLRVITLKNSLDLSGVSADIKVHNIDPDVSLVKIDGQYADLRLPVDNLKDYTVYFEGRGSNLYTPFDRGHATDSSFKVTVGTGKKNSFWLKCSNCTLDMK
ncbi:MAG: hypothetical protein Q8927_19745 [Bacteroidota bacterium]|nr:hypothetical protein [Bacteroidota bacterium]MDP4259651.1 hypothetical protein [Bacteroidota bacterium]